MVDQCVLPSPLVVDDFLEEADFAEVRVQLSEASSQLADEKLDVLLKPAVAKKLRTFINPHNPYGVVNNVVENAVSVQAQVHYGPHYDHVDTTSDGNVVDGCICLVYISGTGTLIFTEQSLQGGEPIEHHIEVRPNRAVMWQNSKHSHRVEADVNCVPRTMLGPFAVDACGNFISTGANSLNRSLMNSCHLLCLNLVAIALVVIGLVAIANAIALFMGGQIMPATVAGIVGSALVLIPLGLYCSGFSGKILPSGHLEFGWHPRPQYTAPMTHAAPMEQHAGPISYAPPPEQYAARVSYAAPAQQYTAPVSYAVPTQQNLSATGNYAF